MDLSIDEPSADTIRTSGADDMGWMARREMIERARFAMLAVPCMRGTQVIVFITMNTAMPAKRRFLSIMFATPPAMEPRCAI